jgi:two-component system response regulator RegA
MKAALVVDDDKQVSSLVARWLSKAGYDVSTFEQFGAARERILSDAPLVLVVDVRLEGFNGIQLAILTRQLQPEARIVVLSGFDDPVLRKEASACGAVYLCKPLSAEDLLAAIEPQSGSSPDAA